MEAWRPVVGWDAYEISDQGRVRSVDREVWDCRGRLRRLKGKLLAPTFSQGYFRVSLSLDNHAFKVKVCSLVLEAFVGPHPEGMECCHGPGGSADDRLENLRWGTSSENKFDIVRAGNHFQARKTYCKNKHEFTPENTIERTDSKGHRRCLACKREGEHRRYWKARAA